MAAKQLVEKAIADNAVAVFSKSYCPYCKQAKNTLAQVTKNFYVIELDQDENGADIQNYLREKTGQSTVPNIFISQEHIGGNSDLTSLNSSGKLKSMLA